MAPKKRREHGSGSIYKTKSGSWVAQDRIDGQLVRRRAPDEQAAKLALKELQELKARRIDLRGGAQSVIDWATACLAEKVQLRQLKPRSIEFERSILERYIIPQIGTQALRDIRPMHLQQVINTTYTGIQVQGRYSGARTAHGVAGVLEEYFTLAYERKLIPDNPYAGIVLPVYRARPIEPLTDQQLRDLLAAAAGQLDKRPTYVTKDRKTKHRPPLSTNLELLWWCIAFLGLRLGEGLGLHWSGYDATEQTIHIDQQVQHVRGELQLTSPKTAAGTRVLPLPRRLAQRIAEMPRTNELFFPAESGKPRWPDGLDAQFRRLRTAAGLSDTVKPHHLRHTLSTLLDECGASEAIKAAILGHAKQTVTQRYTHARIAAMRTAIQQVEDRILGD